MKSICKLGTGQVRLHFPRAQGEETCVLQWIPSHTKYNGSVQTTRRQTIGNKIKSSNWNPGCATHDDECVRKHMHSIKVVYGTQEPTKSL